MNTTSLNSRLDGALELEGRVLFERDGVKYGQTAHITENSKHDLRPVADFMDKHPEIFGRPDSGSWANELREDNFLNRKETMEFQHGISLFKDAHAGDSRNALGSLEGLRPPFFGPGPAMPPSPFSNILHNFPMLENLLKDILGLLGPNQSYLSPAKGLAAAHRLDGAITPRDGDVSGDKGGYITPESARELRPVAQYMDAHPEKFGIPDSGSWVNELSEDGYLDKFEFNKFREGIADVKEGIYDNAFSSGDTNLFGSNSDARWAARSVVNQLFD